jgi:hypothetical protein
VYLGFDAQQRKQEEASDKKMKDSVALQLKPALPLTAYCGNYFNDVYGNMNVVQEAGELKMKFSHHPNTYAKLETLGGNRFYVTFSDPILGKAIFPFTVINDKVTAATVKVADFVEYNPYEFKKIK